MCLIDKTQKKLEAVQQWGETDIQFFLPDLVGPAGDKCTGKWGNTKQNNSRG